jgi:glucose-1-phosphate thymidylyltransferase
MKAIIPVAGAGTKLRPHTYTQPKALMPMAGKTILAVIVDALLSEGIEEYIFIIGYLGDKIQDYVMRTYPFLRCTFVTQNDRRGTGHAIWLTKEAVKNDEVLIVFGDTICDFDVQSIIKSKVSQIGIRRVDDPRSFGVAEVDDENNVLRVVEKPLIPKSNMAMVGVYKINETCHLFEALDKYLHNRADEDGEYHLTHALQTMIEQGIPFKAFKVNNWFDCGKKETLLETNATLLKLNADKEGMPIPAFPDSVIIPPVNIGAGCTIENSIIGPSVSIGENTTIRSSIIRNSIVGSFAVLDEVVLKSSIIGSDAYIHGMSQSLNIGDNTDIDLG